MNPDDDAPTWLTVQYLHYSCFADEPTRCTLRTPDEDSDVKDSDDEYQYNHPLHRQDQVKIQGVCKVTEELIRETLTTYNKEAIDWIKDHLHCESHAR